MTLQEEKQFRIECARMGAEIALSKVGKMKDEISQNEAFNRFGRAMVENLRSRGLIKRTKLGDKNSTCTYSLMELETVINLVKEGKIL